jgi:hypothetical protein
MRHDEPAGYERTDADAAGTYRAAFLMLAVMVLTALGLVPVYRLLARQEAKAQPPPAEVVKNDMSEPAQSFPRLVTSEPMALAEFRAQEAALLDSYGWVEKDKGLARIPIDDAMRIVAEHGLPKFGPAPGAPASAAAAQPKAAAAAPEPGK